MCTYRILNVLLVLTLVFHPSVWANTDANASANTNPNKDFIKLYECSKKVFSLSWPLAYPIDTRTLGDDLFFMLDGYKKELHIFSPYFVGKTDLTLDKDGKEIVITKDNRPQYNIRIPYFPKNTYKPTGYYYLTINDTLWDGHHDSRINVPERFLPGPAQINPDFSQISQTKNGVTLLKVGEQDMFSPSLDKFHSLDIEDQIWNEHANHFEDTSKALLISEVVNKIGGISDEIERTIATTIHGYRFGGTPPSMEEFINKYNKIYEDTVNTCQNVAKELSLPSISQAFDAQKNDPSQAACINYQSTTMPKWKWHAYKQELHEGKLGEETYTYSFSVNKINGSINCQELYSTLTNYLKAFDTCQVTQMLKGHGWSAFKADFEINPNGEINQQNFNAYTVNASLGNYEQCLYTALKNTAFKNAGNQVPVKIIATFSVGRKQK